MAVTQTIQLKRRIDGATGFAGVTLAEGEPAFNDAGNELVIGGTGGAHEMLVSAARQLELAGTQTVVAGAAKHFDLTNFKLAGPTGMVLSSAGGTGDLAWIPAAGATGSVAVYVEDPITGSGMTGDPLGMTAATDAMIDAGTDDTFPITSRGLRYLTGDPDNLPGTTTTIIEGITYLETLIEALTGAIVLQGTWNADDDQITPGMGSPITANAPLPGATADNRGWYLIVDTAGTIAAGHAAPAGNYAVGDWVLSNGNAWLHFAMNLGTIAAINVSFTPPAGMTATNVQYAIEQVFTEIGDLQDALEAGDFLHIDNVSIIGSAGPTGAGATASNVLMVGVVDGGTF